MDHSRRLPHSGSWMDTLKLAASIRSVPSEWVPHAAPQGQEQPEWFPVLKPGSPSRCPSPQRAHKRFRSEGSIGLDHLDSRPETSEFFPAKKGVKVPTAVHSPLTSRASMTSLDELTSSPPLVHQHSQPAGYQPLARGLFRSASQASFGADLPLPQPSRGSREGSPDLTSALYSLLHDDSPDVESLLKAMLKAKLSQAMADGLQDCDAHHLRQIQNLVWDIQAEEEGKGEAAWEASPNGPVLSECLSGNSGGKRKRGGCQSRDFDLNC